HTRCVKWIEFVFCPGADGTQVIKTSKILEPKLGYYLLSNTDIPNLGYSRHMRELKEKDFRLPLDIKEQQKIAAVLSAADAEISTLEKKLACLRDEKKALMQQLLTGKRRVKVDEAVAE
ncbi:restriction endonuclease subunit S, partial [Escherichia coli]|nr:restriction endonuclease subunit S [Escherichia coli]